MAIGDVTIVAEEVFGSRNVVIGTIATGAVYPSGGLVPSVAKFGLVEIDFVEFEPLELAATTALLPRYDRATDKVMLHEGDGPTVAGPLAETDEDLTAAGPVYFMAYGRKSGFLT